MAITGTKRETKAPYSKEHQRLKSELKAKYRNMRLKELGMKPEVKKEKRL